MYAEEAQGEIPFLHEKLPKESNHFMDSAGKDAAKRF